MPNTKTLPPLFRSNSEKDYETPFTRAQLKALLKCEYNWGRADFDMMNKSGTPLNGTAAEISAALGDKLTSCEVAALIREDRHNGKHLVTPMGRKYTARRKTRVAVATYQVFDESGNLLTESVVRRVTKDKVLTYTLE